MKVKILASQSAAKAFRDTTVKAVAKAYKVQIGTLSKLNASDLQKALDSSHMSFGRGVRNFIRTETKDPMARDPIALDNNWKSIIKQAIKDKLYDPNLFNAKELATLSGKKFKELDLRMFKDAEAFKAFAIKLRKRFVKDLGADIKLEKLKLSEVFEPSISVGPQKFNSITVQLPLRHQLAATKSDKFYVYLGSGTVHLAETEASTRHYIDKIHSAKLTGSTAQEVIEHVMKMLRIKTTKIEKPVAAKAGKASAIVIEKFKADFSKLGIDMIPAAADNINFYHPQRGAVKLKFKLSPKGAPVLSLKYKASFGETFDLSKPASLPSLKKNLKKIL